STNFLISHGQATRSTFTCSRVIHFIVLLLAGGRCPREWRLQRNHALQRAAGTRRRRIPRPTPEPSGPASIKRLKREKRSSMHFAICLRPDERSKCSTWAKCLG